MTIAFDYRGWGASEGRVILTKPIERGKPGEPFTAEVKEIREVVDPLDQTTDLQNVIHWVHGEKQCDATLSRIDAVDVDFMIEGDQTSAAAVESRTKISELLTVAGETGTRVAECRDPAVAVAVGIAPVVPRGQIQDGIAPRHTVEYVLLLVGHGHLFSPCLTG